MGDSEQPEQPEPQPKLDEQTEAALATAIRRQGDEDVSKNPNFQARVDLFNSCVEHGMSPEAAGRTVGKIIIQLGENAIGSEIYKATIYSTGKRFANLHAACAKEMTEQVFFDAIQGRVMQAI